MNTATNDSESVRSRPAQKKVRKVMGEFKDGDLKSSSGQQVTSKAQATAIAINSAKKKK